MRNHILEGDAVATKSGTRTRKSKVEVQDEFEKIKEDSSQEKLDFNAKAAELSKIKELETRELVKDVSVDGIVKKLSSMGMVILANWYYDWYYYVSRKACHLS
jgi:hypothetical protein